MPWFKVDDHLVSHPAAILAGDEALGYWMRLGCWMAQYPEYGDVVPDVIAERLDGRCKRRSLTKLRRLVEVGLMVPVERGYRMHPTLDISGSGLMNRAWDLERDQSERRARITQAVRMEVYERDGHACVECSATEDLSLDHIWPWSKGGSDELDNLRTLCRPCNSRKGARV